MKPRVAYLGVKGLPSKSGTERVLEAIVTRITDQFDITVYCDAEYTPPGTKYEGIRFIRIPTIKGRHFKPISLGIFSAVHALLFGRYDVIHMNGVENCFTLPFLKLRYRVISTSHATPGRMPTSKWNKAEHFLIDSAEYPFLYLSDCPTAISMQDSEYFYDRYKKKVLYIPNGVDCDIQADREAATRFIENLGLLPKSFLLFVAGRIIQRKGCHLLLEAINKLDVTVPVVIVGDLEQVPTYGQHLKQLAGNRPVIFVPPIADRSLLFGILELCKLFVFPSTAEGMSMMLLEAASLGVPMVCSDIPENRTVLDEHVIYFRSADHADLAEKIQWGIENTDELDRLGEFLKDWVKANYSWDSIASQYGSLYRRYVR